MTGQRTGVDAGNCDDAVPREIRVEGLGRASDAYAFRGVPVRAIGIAVVEQRERALAQLEPRALGYVAGPVEQRPRALQPAAGDGMFAAKRPGVPRDPDGEARGAAAVTAIAIQPIRMLARVEYHVGEIEPPARKPQPFKGLRAFAMTKRRLERSARYFPLAARERLIGDPALEGSRLRHETRS